MSASVLTVSQINTYIKTLIDGDNKLRNVFISGEISNFNNTYRSGHFYFSLKDERSVLKAVMFSSNASRVKFRPENGMKVLVSGRISIYEATGQYQLYVESMQPDGIGALTIEFEQLKRKLESEGFFDSEHKKDIPFFPKKIGVITSPTGAVIQDIRNVISRRCPLTEIVLCPTSVQGEFAAKELSKAVTLFNCLNNVDVIIIGRGGGSFEDLNCFNSEALVRCIYDSKIPIISAVGHETDYTFCDFVSDLRAPTPSAAAELAVPKMEDLLNEVSQIFGYIKYTVSNNINNETQYIDRLDKKIKNHRYENYIENERKYFDYINKQIASSFNYKIRSSRFDIDVLSEKINNLSPLNLLKKGYSIVEKNKKTVRSVNDIEVGDMINIRVSDGTIDCCVEYKTQNGD